MAETLTVDTTPQTETMPDNLTPEEQDSLALGEKMAQDQEQLLAGKYKNAEELEKAYMELQTKLGEQGKEETETASTEESDEPKLSEGASLITDAQKEYYDNDNKLSEETLAKFSEMSSSELLQAYIELNANNPAEPQAEAADISEAQIAEIKESAGGDKAYANVVNWAKANLDSSQTDAFDEVVNTGSIQAIKLAVAGLKSEYDKANGVEGRMVTGKTAPPQSGDVFRSQAELVEAMSDRRYDNDPAYRQDVIEKLERSGLDF